MLMLAFAVVPLLAACEVTGRKPEDATGRRGAPTPANAVERRGKLAGELLVTPRSVRAGRTVSITVKNAGEATMFYGLANRIERRTNSGWKDATEDVYGTPDPAFLLIRLIAKPGESAGPRHNAVVDRIRLPRNLRPGRYRILKSVSGDDRGRAPPLTLHAIFEVRAGSSKGG
jgi:hypothetical protein